MTLLELPDRDTFWSWRGYRSYDWGFAAPASLGWWKVDPDGNVWRYRELYRRGMEVEDFMEEVLELQVPGEEELVEYTVADPSLWNSDRGPSIAERAADVGVALTPADRRSSSDQSIRVAGWSLMRRYIDPDTRPVLHVSRTCQDWWRTVPALIHDESKVEDVDTDLEDHAADETRYFLMSRPEPTFVPAPHVEDKFLEGGPDWIAARARRLQREGKFVHKLGKPREKSPELGENEPGQVW